MHRLLCLGLVLITACSSTVTITPDTSSPSTVASTSPATTVPEQTTTSPSPETTEPDPLEEPAWAARASEEWVLGFLAALTAGAWEQAAFSAENMGIVFDGQRDDETPAEAIQRQCTPDLCSGPYEIVSATAGLVDPITFQAAAEVEVRHVESGETGVLVVATFEGRPIIASLPPLHSGSGAVPLVRQLFGDDMPERAVVRRFDAFEIWEAGEGRWVTNVFANDSLAMEDDVALSHRPGDDLTRVVRVSEPTVLQEGPCLRLIELEGAVVVTQECFADGLVAAVAETGVDVGDRLPPLDPAPESGYAWLDARGGTVVTGSGDAEGNLLPVETTEGVSLLGNGYAGFTRLSTDGALFAFVDHADPAAYNHFWSPVVVVVDTATGSELGRWTVAGPVTCLEMSRSWVLACEGEPPTGGDVPQVALVAIDLETGRTARVETPERIFLP